MEKQLRPLLRFPEFNSNLTEVGFTDLGKIMIGLTHKPNYLESGVIFLSSKNISKDYIDFDNVQYISKKEFDEMSESTKPKKGDILFTRVGSNLGNPKVLEKDVDFAIFVSLGIFRVNKKATNYFVRYWMDTELFWKQIEQKVAGGAKNNLNSTWLREFRLNIPNIPEQQKIASFLTDVDEKITKLTKKKDLLEQYKKGIMQKIFNQELRFKDENGNEFPLWQKNKLGKSVKFLKGKGLPKSEIVGDGKYKCIHYGELFTKYNELIDSIISRTNDNDKTILSKVNDVLMPTSDVTPNGLATASCIKESDVILGGDVLIIRQDIKAIEGAYLAYYIKRFRNDVMKLVSGSTVYHLYGSDMKNLQVLIPCLDEQIKIANFLTDIDLKITVLNTKIESNQTFKKGLLQKMFV